MNQPLVTALLPVFNGARFIGEAIESVLGQTYARIEIIVIDDGSTDETATIAARYPAVTLLQTPNRGVSSARNTGLEHAKGELIAYLDADDLWLPEKVGRQVEAALADPSLGYVLCWLRYIAVEGEPVPETFNHSKLGTVDPGYAPSCWLVRRTALDRVGGFSSGLRYAQDMDWLARASDLGLQYRMLEEELVVKRVHRTNLSNSARAVWSEAAGVLRESVRRKREGAAG